MLQKCMVNYHVLAIPRNTKRSAPGRAAGIYEMRQDDQPGHLELTSLAVTAHPRQEIQVQVGFPHQEVRRRRTGGTRPEDHVEVCTRTSPKTPRVGHTPHPFGLVQARPASGARLRIVARLGLYCSALLDDLS